MVAAGVIASQQFTAPPWVPPAWWPANGVAWFDASDAASVVRNGSNQVTQWVDKRAGAYTLNRAASNAVRTGVNTQNGLATVTFDGTASFLNVSGPVIDASNCALFGVARCQTTGNYRTWASFGGQTAGIGLTMVGEKGGSAGWGALISYVEWWLPTGPAVNTFNQQTLTVAAKAAVLRKDKVQAGAKTIAPNVAARQFYLGGDATMGTVCDVCELVVVNGVCSVAERDAIEAYLQTKWGTGAAPPPAYLPPNTVAWFDASDPASVTKDVYGVVGWRDKKAGAYNLINDPYTRPEEVTYPGPTKQNNLNTMSFSGLGGLYNITGPIITSTNCMMIVAARTRAGANSRTYLSFGGQTTGLGLTHLGETGFSSGWGALITYVEWWTPGAADSTFHVQTLTVGAGTGTLLKNATQVGAKAVSPAAAAKELWVGGDPVAGTGCDICEIIIVSGAWTVAERDAAIAGLRTKWAL